jgi:hypothetical protein
LRPPGHRPTRCDGLGQQVAMREFLHGTRRDELSRVHIRAPGSEILRLKLRKIGQFCDIFCVREWREQDGWERAELSDRPHSRTRCSAKNRARAALAQGAGSALSDDNAAFSRGDGGAFSADPDARSRGNRALRSHSLRRSAKRVWRRHGQTAHASPPVYADRSARQCARRMD